MKLIRIFLKPVTSFLCAVSLISNGIAPWSIAFADEVGPTIDHAPPNEATAGAPFTLEAYVSDESGVSQVILQFRASDDGGTWSSKSMEESSVTGLYGYTYVGNELQPPGLDYFIQAEDDSENKNRNQDGFEFDSYRLNIIPPAISVATAPEVPVRTNTNNILIGLGALLAVGVLVGAGGSVDGGSEIQSSLVIK